nr:MAG TPA: hypothetical protein [Caudoviricetes sp.]
MTFREAMRTTLEEFEIYNMAYAIQQEDKHCPARYDLPGSNADHARRI